MGTYSNNSMGWRMHIFIDESGNFLPSLDRPGISLVGSLTIPTSRLSKVEQKYAKLRRGLPLDRGEVKGRLLTEVQVASVIDLLRKNDALLELVGIDLNLHSAEDIACHRAELADAMVRGLTEEHHLKVRRDLDQLGLRIKALSPQLYVQGTVMFELVRLTCNHAINYHAQRQPRELEGFSWAIDAKDKKRTNWEELWKSIVLPILQSKSISEPSSLLDFGDYTYFKRFQGAVPEWLPRPPSGSGHGINLNLLLMEDFRYSSDTDPGLELIDILVNAARRALVGTLQMAGWYSLPGLMINRAKQCIHLVALHRRPLTQKLGYETVISHFFRGGKSMIAPRFVG